MPSSYKLFTKILPKVKFKTPQQKELERKVKNAKQEFVNLRKRFHKIVKQMGFNEQYFYGMHKEGFWEKFQIDVIQKMSEKREKVFSPQLLADLQELQNDLIKCGKKDLFKQNVRDDDLTFLRNMRDCVSIPMQWMQDQKFQKINYDFYQTFEDLGITTEHFFQKQEKEGNLERQLLQDVNADLDVQAVRNKLEQLREKISAYKTSQTSSKSKLENARLHHINRMIRRLDTAIALIPDIQLASLNSRFSNLFHQIGLKEADWDWSKIKIKDLEQKITSRVGSMQGVEKHLDELLTLRRNLEKYKLSLNKLQNLLPQEKTDKIIQINLKLLTLEVLEKAISKKQLKQELEREKKLAKSWSKMSDDISKRVDLNDYDKAKALLEQMQNVLINATAEDLSKLSHQIAANAADKPYELQVADEIGLLAALKHHANKDKGYSARSPALLVGQLKIIGKNSFLSDVLKHAQESDDKLVHTYEMKDIMQANTRVLPIFIKGHFSTLSEDSKLHTQVAKDLPRQHLLVLGEDGSVGYDSDKSKLAISKSDSTITFANAAAKGSQLLQKAFNETVDKLLVTNPSHLILSTYIKSYAHQSGFVNLGQSLLYSETQHKNIAYEVSSESRVTTLQADGKGGIRVREAFDITGLMCEGDEGYVHSKKSDKIASVTVESVIIPDVDKTTGQPVLDADGKPIFKHEITSFAIKVHDEVLANRFFDIVVNKEEEQLTEQKSKHM